MAVWKDAPHPIKFLRGLNPQESDLILAEARSRRFPANSAITYQDESADYLMLLWKGRARYFFETPNSKKLLLKWIAPGQIFGGAALSSRPRAYLVGTEAVYDSIALEWNRSTIYGLARRFPQLMENIHDIDIEYVAWYVAAHAALASQNARERLASVLFTLAKSVGRKVSGGVELDVTNEELANSANITQYTASRFMSEWQKSGAICKQRGKVVLRSPEGLFQSRRPRQEG